MQTRKLKHAVGSNLDRLIQAARDTGQGSRLSVEERQLCQKDVKHAFYIGDRVAVYYFNAFKMPFLEGFATVEEAITEIPRCYRVRFETEPHRTHLRLVHHGSFQTDIPGTLGAFHAEWRAGLGPELFEHLLGERI